MRFVNSVFLLLLLYIVIFIVFWEMSLQKQSGRIYAQELITLETRMDSTRFPEEYYQQVNGLQKNLHMRTMQYIWEGATFVIVIIIGTFIVYSSFRRSLNLSRQQNNFMLSVTHELKSPVAAIKLNLQTIEKHRLDAQRQAHLVSRSIKEANRLNDLCNNILFASQIEGRQFKVIRETFDFSEMAEDSVSEYAMRYPQRFEEDITGGCTISGDKMMLQIVLNNLLENAVKYTPNDQPITVKVFKKNDRVVLQVIDRGPGIPDQEKKKIFNKFYRVGNEESRKSTGTGLGLYLANKVVLQHNGRLNIRDNSPNGAIFEIVL